MPPSRPRQGRRRGLAVALAIDGRQHRDIAAAASIAAPTLSGILTGRIRDPRPQTRAQIAQALGRSENEIFPEYADEAAGETFGWDKTLAARVRAECEAQGVPYELSDEQMDFIGAVVFSDPRRRKPDLPTAS